MRKPASFSRSTPIFLNPTLSDGPSPRKALWFPVFPDTTFEFTPSTSMILNRTKIPTLGFWLFATGRRAFEANFPPKKWWTPDFLNWFAMAYGPPAIH